MKTKLIFLGLILLTIGCNTSQQGDKTANETGAILYTKIDMCSEK